MRTWTFGLFVALTVIARVYATGVAQPSSSTIEPHFIIGSAREKSPLPSDFVSGRLRVYKLDESVPGTELPSDRATALPSGMLLVMAVADGSWISPQAVIDNSHDEHDHRSAVFGLLPAASISLPKSRSLSGHEELQILNLESSDHFLYRQGWNPGKEFACEAGTVVAAIFKKPDVLELSRPFRVGQGKRHNLQFERPRKGTGHFFFRQSVMWAPGGTEPKIADPFVTLSANGKQLPIKTHVQSTLKQNKYFIGYDIPAGKYAYDVAIAGYPRDRGEVLIQSGRITRIANETPMYPNR